MLLFPQLSWTQKYVFLRSLNLKEIQISDYIFRRGFSSFLDKLTLECLEYENQMDNCVLKSSKIIFINCLLCYNVQPRHLLQCLYWSELTINFGCLPISNTPQSNMETLHQWDYRKINVLCLEMQTVIILIAYFWFWGPLLPESKWI